MQMQVQGDQICYSARPSIVNAAENRTMAIFIALLRAVNVGGTGTLAMTDLKSLCEGLGLTDVRTYIQSGNVVFGCAWTEARAKAALGTALSTRMGKPTDVLVRSATEMTGVLDRNPFPSVQGSKVSVWFFDKTPNKALFATIAIPDREEIRLAGREVYVHYPDGMGRSKLKLSSLGVATARNINTVAKLVEMTKFGLVMPTPPASGHRRH
jgi:uncharacterized protein (DUF1697 family)